MTPNVGNIFPKQKSITRGLDLLFAADFLVHQVTKDDVFEAAGMAKQYQTSVYDMLYAVVVGHTQRMMW